MKSFEEIAMQFGTDSEKGTAELWKEALQQLRFLADNFWRTIKFFIAVHGGILGGLIALIAGREAGPTTLQLGLATLIAATGAYLAWVALKIFTKHREHYVRMLQIKTLLEDKLSLYSCAPFSRSGDDLGFEWRIEKIEEFRQNVSSWRAAYMWVDSGSAGKLRQVFRGATLLYTLSIFGLVTWTCVSAFPQVAETAPRASVSSTNNININGTPKIPNSLQVDTGAVSVISGIGFFGLLSAFFTFVLHVIAKEQIKNSIKSEYDQRLETHKAQLKAATDVENEKLRAALQIQGTEHQVRFSRLHEETAETIASTYSHLRELVIAVFDYTKILEFQNDLSKEQRRELVQNALTNFRNYYQPRRIYIPKETALRIDALQEKITELSRDFARHVEKKEDAEKWVEIRHNLERQAVPLFESLEDEFRILLGHTPSRDC